MNPLIRKLSARDTLSNEERAMLDRMIAQTRDFERGQDVVREGDRPTYSSLLLNGMACRYTLVGDGRRQITAIHITGDFVDLHSFPLKVMDHSVAALTKCRFAMVPHDGLTRVTETHPHLTRLLWLSTLIDASIHREWIVAMGRRSALGRMAHLICELVYRLGVFDLADRTSVPMPLTQSDLSDALGLSLVHVNRTLREMKDGGVAIWLEDSIAIRDWSKMVEIAEFNPSYLHLGVEPR
jgi:CRP-like cAMP-binding protein